MRSARAGLCAGLCGGLCALWLAAGGAFAAEASATAGEVSSPAMQALGLAKHYYDKGDYVRAAELFHEAYAIEARPEFLYNAGRAEQRAMQLAKALATFGRLLGLPGLEDEIAARTRRHLREIEEVEAEIARAKAQAVAKARAEASAQQRQQAHQQQQQQATAAAAANKAATPSDRRGMLVAAAGGGLALFGGAIFGVGFSRGEALATKLRATDGEGRITAISWSEAAEEAGRVRKLEITGGVLAAVGVTAAIAGITWSLLPVRGAEVAVAPAAAGRGLSLSWRF